MPTVNAYGPRKVATEAIPGVRRTAAETPESEGAGFQQARAQALGQLGQVGSTVFGAARAVWQQHQEIRLQEIKRADDIAVLNAENQLATWENTRIYGPTGALTQQGKNAFGLPEQVATEYQHQAGEIGVDARHRAPTGRLSARRPPARGQPGPHYPPPRVRRDAEYSGGGSAGRRRECDQRRDCQRHRPAPRRRGARQRRVDHQHPRPATRGSDRRPSPSKSGRCGRRCMSA